MSHRPRRYQSDLNFAIDKKFREAGIEIPFPQRDLNIRSGILNVAPLARPPEQERAETAS